MVRRALTRIAHEIAEKNSTEPELAIIGIQRGGVHFAERLGRLMEGLRSQPVSVGLLDVSMHRDDLDQRPNPEVHPTTIPFDLTGKTVILVDDVLCSGRTTRAAMDSLTDLGRPRAIQLAVLIDRGQRELPIKATFVGKNVPTGPSDRVSVRWREDSGQDSVVLESA